MIYTPILRAVSFILLQVFFEGKDSSFELQSYFKLHKELGSKDRKIINSLVYYIVRWWSKLQYATGSREENYSVESINSVISLAANLLNYTLKKPEDLPECKKVWIKTYNDTNLPSNVQHAIPSELFNRIKEECGESTDSILESLNGEARVCIRLNRIKGTHKDLEKALKEADIDFQKSKITPDGYILGRQPNLVQHEIYKSGWIEFQDEASQQLLTLAEPQPSTWVLDVCAGKGGKTLHAASLMENKGIIIASDLDMNRLKELERRAERAGSSIVQYEKPELIFKYRDSMDMVIIDAPCSGLGTLMRKPDIKWKLKTEKIDIYIDIQKELLENNHLLVKRGGKLVYAVCSILPSEGEKQVESFLSENKNYSLLQQQRYHPHIHGCDGFYVAVMRREG